MSCSIKRYFLFGKTYYVNMFSYKRTTELEGLCVKFLALGRTCLAIALGIGEKISAHSFSSGFIRGASPIFKPLL